MKQWQLNQILPHLQEMKRLLLIKRVGDNSLLLKFEEAYFIFDMHKSDSLIYPRDAKEEQAKTYNAPFDIQLSKQCSGTHITKVELFNDDKIIHFILEKQSSYKSHSTHLYF